MLADQFCFKDTIILRRYCFFLAAGNNKFQRANVTAIRVCCKCANESTRRLVEDGMSKGLINTHTARGFSVLYHLFARKQGLLCSSLSHKSYLHTTLLHRSIRDSFSALELSRTSLLGASQPRVFARLLVGN